MRRVPLILRPYAPGDEARFVPRADFAREAEAIGHDWAAGQPAGHVWTLARWGGDIVGVAGARPQGGDPRDFELWASFAPLSPREIAWGLRLARSRMNMLRRMAGAWRFVAYAVVANAAAIRTLCRLGFRADRCVTVPGLGQYLRMTRS